MRLLFACALLVLCVSSGDALTCNFCTSSESDSCVPTTQTCPVTMTTCGAVVLMDVPAVIRSCMDMANCENWLHNPTVDAFCCSTDNCN